MVFITRCFKSAAKPAKQIKLEVRRQGFCAFVAAWVCTLLLCFAPTSRAADLSQLTVERAEDAVYLSAIVRFDLPTAVDDALAKGVALFFVAEVDVYQNRWYWTDKRVASATRTIRLAFQPLTRRWRVNIVSGLINSSAGLRATLNQNYDILPEAMSAVQRLSRWRIADNSEIENDAPYRLEFSFNLDLSQLPRPLQIGVLGQKDWAVAVLHNERLNLAAYKPVDKAKPAPPPAKEADK